YVEGYSVDGAHDAGLAYEQVLRRAPAERGVELLSADELDYERARACAGGAGAVPDNIFFSRGRGLVRGRGDTSKFTIYDGVFSSKTALAGLRAVLEEQKWRFAPTTLETYARCPFDYFVTRILGVEVVEEPERMVSIAPGDRGTLVHQILARLFREFQERGFLPLSAAPAEDVFKIVDTVVTRILDEFSKTNPVGLPVFWEMDKRLVRESVRVFVEEERLEDDGFVPAQFERWFGGDRDGIDVSYECGGRAVSFLGRIDRIDTAADGRFRVIDYKTGRLAGKDQDIAHGMALQLPIYLIAAARILEAEIRAGEARYRHVGAGGGPSAVLFSGSRWDESSAGFEKTIDVITRGIERGIFFAPANDEACRYCDVRVACTAGMPRLFARKAENDERAREYMDLRAGTEEAE
ncbi:MAG: PD-(D/E)XK nuclease family protein, partial [Candidatus Krumholzibacteriaceae bacterium]